MYNLVIFGERPGPNTDPLRPLYPHTTTGAAARLIEMLGISQEEYLRIVRMNVVNDQTTPTSSDEVRRNVYLTMAHYRSKGPVRFLVLGRSAAQALPKEYRDMPFGTIYGGIMIIPHPSGRNRYYNSQANKEFIIQGVRKFAGIL